MTTLYEDVGKFHDRMGLPHVDQGAPKRMTHAEFRYRTAFMMEELREFIEAHARGDLPDMADSLADLVWVALGTAHYLRVPFDEVWSEVYRANMEKRPWREGDPVKPRNLATQGEVVKPENWRGPDVQQVLYRRAQRFGDLSI
jgi:predicted HAD superfamily Cof-like phosphohydrolase